MSTMTALPSSKRSSLMIYMDRMTAPLNPCSVETIPEPVRLANGQYVWPTMVSCYELQPDRRQRIGQMDLHMIHVPDLANCLSTSSPLKFNHHYTDQKKETVAEVAKAEADCCFITTVVDPKIEMNKASSDSSNRISGGILDGKWNRRIPQTVISNDDDRILASCWSFASAHSDGTVHIHALEIPNYEVGLTDGNQCTNQKDSDDTDNDHHYPYNKLSNTDNKLFSVKHLGQSSRADGPASKITPLCLSLAWDSPSIYQNDDRYSNHFDEVMDNNFMQDRIISTYSDGTAAVHDVIYCYNNNSNISNINTKDQQPSSCIDRTPSDGVVRCDSVQLLEYDRWYAHSMFQTPSEVWTGCFIDPVSTGAQCKNKKSNVALTGGDEGNWKVWDLRATSRAMQIIRKGDKNCTDVVGITCLSPHPNYGSIVAVGSYDESVSIYDMRYLSSSLSNTSWMIASNSSNNTTSEDSGRERSLLSQTRKPLGGGVWRMKWHPYTTHRMLVAAMNGGCFVYNFRGLVDHCSLTTTTSTSSSTSSSVVEQYYDTPTSTKVSTGPIIAKCKKKFQEHESMVYGVDWLVCPHPTENGHFEAAVSCSFYDRAVYLWDTIF